MIERSLSFDSSAYSMDAVQRAAYRFADRCSAEVTNGGASIEVTLSLTNETLDGDRLLADLRTEALDQVLRERIRNETEDVRKFVLSLAFARTGLTEEDV